MLEIKFTFVTGLLIYFLNESLNMFVDGLQDMFAELSDSQYLYNK